MKEKNGIFQKGLKILFVASYPPRECGIATFTKDLREAILEYNKNSLGFVIAINDIRNKYNYEPIVKYEIDQEDLDTLDRAARYINECGADIVSIQHEFGIWGGFDGEFIGYFLKKIKIPIVTTLHSIPFTKESIRRENRIRLIRLIARYSKKIVVNIKSAKKQLQKYGIPQKKLSVIHHGAPDIEFITPEAAKAKIGLTDKKIISTHGLIASEKGLEFVIEAMPEILKKHPNTVYQILGKPHPSSSSAKDYYQNLKNYVKQLKLENNVLFVNRYLTINEIISYLQATDIYITPYLSLNRISSGTLTYAVAIGRCVVSTPYPHAQELLKDKGGVFVERKNSEAIAKTINYLFDHPEEIKRKAKQNYECGRNFIWSKVAQKYFSLFSEILR